MLHHSTVDFTGIGLTSSVPNILTDPDSDSDTNSELISASNDGNASLDEAELAITDKLSVRLTFSATYFLIFIVGVSGNALVVTAVLQSRRMRTTTNLLISNLALSDIIFIVFMFFTPYATFFPVWPFGDVLCRIIAMASCCTVFVSSFTSTVIAIDRYCRIVHPLLPRLRIRGLSVVIVAIWLASIAISSPLAATHGVSVSDGNTICNENWPAQTHRRAFGVATICLQFIVPSVIITFCYARVLKRITERLQKRSFASTRNPARELHELRHKQRMTRMLLAMVGQFAGCWIFFNLYHIMDDLIALDQLIDYDTHTLLFLIVYTIASSSVVYNPFIYGWMNENFRKEFAKMLSCIFGGDRNRIPTAVVEPRHRSHRTPVLVVVGADGTKDGGADDDIEYERTTHGISRSYYPSPVSVSPSVSPSASPTASPSARGDSMTVFVTHSASTNNNNVFLAVSLSLIDSESKNHNHNHVHNYNHSLVNTKEFDSI